MLGHRTSLRRGGGSVFVRRLFRPGPDANPESRVSQPEYVRVGADLRRVSGSPHDGVWRGEVTILPGMRGTWALRVHVSDGESPGKVYEGDELAVAGPSAVRSRVTAPPAAPQNPQGVTQRVQLPWPVPVGWYWVRRVR